MTIYTHNIIINKQFPPNLLQHQTGLVLTNCNILLLWKRSRHYNIRDILLPIFSLLEVRMFKLFSLTAGISVVNEYLRVKKELF